MALQGAVNWGTQWILTPSTAAASAFVIVSSILFYRALKHYRAMLVLAAVPPAETPPDCMVVIPARNEEGVVGAAVKSLPPDTVIVVDDFSTDRTAEEARAAGAGVLEAPPLNGAVGKANACMAGAQVLASRWILFADADTRYQPGFLDAVVQHADNSGVVFLSIHLTPRLGTLSEHVLEPYTVALFSSSATLHRDPTLQFNGQCILALREAYEFIGGHAAVWKHLADDLKLGLLARRHRMKCGVVRAAGQGHVRGDAGWKGAWRKAGRQALRFVHIEPRITAIILFTALFAALWLPLAMWLWFAGNRAAAGALVLVVMLQLRPWYGHRLSLLLAPVAVYAALPLLFNAVITAFLKRHVVWKGRRVKTT